MIKTKNAYFDESGMLCVERGAKSYKNVFGETVIPPNQIIRMFCPFSQASKGGLMRCGDWCPHFGTEVKHKDGTITIPFTCGSGKGGIETRDFKDLRRYKK